MLYKCSAKVVSEIISVIMDKGAYWCKMSCKCYWRVPLWIKPCHFTRQLNKCHKLPVPLWHCERPCGTLMRCVTSQLFSHGGTFHHKPPPLCFSLEPLGLHTGLFWSCILMDSPFRSVWEESSMESIRACQAACLQSHLHSSSLTLKLEVVDRWQNNHWIYATTLPPLQIGHKNVPYVPRWAPTVFTLEAPFLHITLNNK